MLSHDKKSDVYDRKYVHCECALARFKQLSMRSTAAILGPKACGSRALIRLHLSLQTPRRCDSCERFSTQHAHSTRQRHGCTQRCPARCPYCPLRPRLQPLSLSCGSIDALSAGVAHSTRRACTLLLNYKLAQRYSLALATPVRRHVTLAARSAARRR